MASKDKDIFYIHFPSPLLYLPNFYSIQCGKGVFEGTSGSKNMWPFTAKGYAPSECMKYTSAFLLVWESGFLRLQLKTLECFNQVNIYWLPSIMPTACQIDTRRRDAKDTNLTGLKMRETNSFNRLFKTFPKGSTKYMEYRKWKKPPLTAGT